MTDKQQPNGDHKPLDIQQDSVVAYDDNTSIDLIRDDVYDFAFFSTAPSSTYIDFSDSHFFYTDPASYTINTQLNVIKDMSENGTLDEQETKEMLRYISEAQGQVIESQKKILDGQERILASTKEESFKLAAQIEYLQEQLSDTEKRLKNTIEEKYSLNEAEIIKSMKSNPIEYTSIFSKIGLIITSILFLFFILFGTSILAPKLLIIAIICFSTYLTMAKLGVKRGRK
jgi:polyhydroxyalkanoate synthesis regulator phasin